MQISVYRVTLFCVAHAGLKKSKTKNDLAISVPSISQLRCYRLMTTLRLQASNVENQHEGMGRIHGHNILCRLLWEEMNKADKNVRSRSEGMNCG
jgi:hypothetical protein